MGGDLREKRPDRGEGGRRGHNQAGIQECRSLGGADVVGDLRFVSEKMEAQEGKDLPEDTGPGDGPRCHLRAQPPQQGPLSHQPGDPSSLGSRDSQGSLKQIKIKCRE